MASAAVKERLRKLRQQYGLGEYSDKRSSKPGRKSGKQTGKRGVGRRRTRPRRSSLAARPFRSTSMNTMRGLDPHRLG